MPSPTRGNPAMKFGLIFGAILALLYVANVAVQWLTGAYTTSSQNTNNFTTVHLSDTGASSLLNCVAFLVMNGLTFVAGWQTAKRTGTAGAGSIAGLITGLVGGLVGYTASTLAVLFFALPQLQLPAGSHLTQAQAQGLLMGAAIVGAVLGLFLDVGIGAGMGALGGLVGVNEFRAHLMQTQLQAQPPMYPSMPGQPHPYSAPLYTPQHSDVPPPQQ